MKSTVIYHSADFDGLFSGAVCKRYLPKDTEFIGWDYGDAVPEVSHDRQLYIVDLSIDELMTHPNLIWIDHHKSAIEKYPETIPGCRIDGVAACRLCWDWFANFGSVGSPSARDAFLRRSVCEPVLLTLVGEYDVWDKRDYRSELLQFGLVAHGVERLDDCLALLTDAYDLDGLVEMGQAAFRWQQSFAHSCLLQRSYRAVLQGIPFCVLGSCHARNSMWFPEPAVHKKYGYAVEALLCWRYDGETVSVSLYHRPGFEHHDLSEIAKHYGGGGHKGACGFLCSLNEAALMGLTFVQSGL